LSTYKHTIIFEDVEVHIDTPSRTAMDVQLYVYDLTRGMARTMSASLLGIHLDAVYHTALVFGGIEYFFGQGIQTVRPPGTTHHGQPMEVVSMGTTHLPLETIMEYLESLREIYSAESYDLFAHNCNNFTNDFAMFLVGKGIPDHITNLPKRVLDTPIGQMLKSQIDASMREITQAPTLSSSRPTGNAASVRPAQAASSVGAVHSNGNGSARKQRFGHVMSVTDTATLEKHLASASNTAVTIFFTSSTCAPCKIAYPTFDRLAEQHPEMLFLKIDINEARDIAAKYQIRATPTFITFSKGTQQSTWTGADPNILTANVEQLVLQTFPPHPHSNLKLPSLEFGSLKPVTYTKIPPLEKLMTKLGPQAGNKNLQALRSFVEKRTADPQAATLPDLQKIGKEYHTTLLSLPLETRFAAIDLLRCALIDVRVGSYFATEEKDPSTIATILKHVNDMPSCPHNLRLVTLHLACNLFISPVYTKALLRPEGGNETTAQIVKLIIASLLDHTHPTSRVAASSLAFNLAAGNFRVRREESREGLLESEQVELAAGIVETLGAGDNGDAVKALLLALGGLVYFAPEEGELRDLVQVLEAKDIVVGCQSQVVLAKEVGRLL